MTAYAHVACPSCGAAIAADDMNLSAMAARCRACHAFVDLRASTGAAAAQVPAPQPLPVPQPARIQVLDRGRDLTIVHRWFTWAYVALAVFCLGWNGFLVFWYALALGSGPDLVFALFPLVHVAVGLGLAYATAAGFVNRTVITVDRGHLTVRHGPLPWRGNLDLSAESLEQLFCARREIRNRNGTSVFYDLEAVLRDGTHRTLIKGLGQREHALFMEQTLERHLRIEDRPVRSEMPR